MPTANTSAPTDSSKHSVRPPPADGLAELVRRVEQWHGDGPARRDVAALTLERTDPTTAGR